MAILQPLIDLAELCRLHGVSQAVISPGSRSAALTLAFARNPRIRCSIVMDERAAGFIALGMAQQLRKPVVLICTSGSAAYNFAPAVAEAFFQQVPLLVLTADRPEEWIHQNDGQTIYQSGIFGKHVKAAYDLPADYSHVDARWFINRSVNEALLTANANPYGPVHINVPIREPFYPKYGEKFNSSLDLRFISRPKSQQRLDEETWHQLLNEWEDTDRILIAVGQRQPDPELEDILVKITEEFQIPVLGDVISNLSAHENTLTGHDLYLDHPRNKKLRPALLITTGQSFISKGFKKFISQYPPDRHWHISEDKHIIDTFQSLTKHIPVAPEHFFSQLFEDIDFLRFVQNDAEGREESYQAEWMKEELKARRLVAHYLSSLTVFNDITAVDFLLRLLSNPSILHIGNSMPVRYVNILGLHNQEVKVYCNRGTSGIDGCVSTAVGAAMMSDETVYLLVGDVTFFYDRNGLLNQELPRNLKIILLNNSGGTIFRIIEGPDQQPELERYFETRHSFTARRTAEDSGIGYFQAMSLVELQAAWALFDKSDKCTLLEIHTDPEQDAKVFRQLKTVVGGKM